MAGLAASLGSGAMTNSIADIHQADVLLVTGSNTTEAHPVISLEMKAAVRKHGARLILIDPREIELAEFASAASATAIGYGRGAAERHGARPHRRALAKFGIHRGTNRELCGA